MLSGLNESFPKVLPRPAPPPVTYPSEVRGGGQVKARLPVAFPNGAGGGEGALSPHLLPIECFLPAEPTGQSPGSPNQEHLGGEALSRERRGGAPVWESLWRAGGLPRGTLPLALPHPAACVRTALKSDSRWDAEEQMA